MCWSTGRSLCPRTRHRFLTTRTASKSTRTAPQDANAEGRVKSDPIDLSHHHRMLARGFTGPAFRGIEAKGNKPWPRTWSLPPSTPSGTRSTLGVLPIRRRSASARGQAVDRNGARRTATRGSSQLSGPIKADGSPSATTTQGVSGLVGDHKHSHSLTQDIAVTRTGSPEYPARPGHAHTWLADLRVALDGVDITDGILRQLNWTQLGTGASGFTTDAIDLDGCSCGPREAARRGLARPRLQRRERRRQGPLQPLRRVSTAAAREKRYALLSAEGWAGVELHGVEVGPDGRLRLLSVPALDDPVDLAPAADGAVGNRARRRVQPVRVGRRARGGRADRARLPRAGSSSGSTARAAGLAVGPFGWLFVADPTRRARAGLHARPRASRRVDCRARHAPWRSHGRADRSPTCSTQARRRVVRSFDREGRPGPPLACDEATCDRGRGRDRLRRRRRRERDTRLRRGRSRRGCSARHGCARSGRVGRAPLRGRRAESAPWAIFDLHGIGR